LYDPDKCPFCGGGVTFDSVLDLNICYFCGAQETAAGWMSPLSFRPEGKDTLTLAPDEELFRQLFTLSEKLGQLDVELTKIKAQMESSKGAIQDWIELMRKK
jgi:hypothetical protein